jgi:hypothetical protein
MVLIGASRRVFIETAFLVTSLDQYQGDDSRLVDLICRYTPAEFRFAVRQTSCFLYRGEDVLRPSVLHPEPDLLVQGTYTDNDSALEYFSCLELKLESRAKPSTGHIGTSTQEDAAAWGRVVSVWPLGNHLSYVYPQDSSLFFPGNCNDELVVDQNLETALSTGHELLFASWFDRQRKRRLPPVFSSRWISAFLAIPASEDENIKRYLQQRNYGL